MPMRRRIAAVLNVHSGLLRGGCCRQVFFCAEDLSLRADSVRVSSWGDALPVSSLILMLQRGLHRAPSAVSQNVLKALTAGDQRAEPVRPHVPHAWYDTELIPVLLCAETATCGDRSYSQDATHLSAALSNTGVRAGAGGRSSVRSPDLDPAVVLCPVRVPISIIAMPARGYTCSVRVPCRSAGSSPHSSAAQGSWGGTSPTGSPGRARRSCTRTDATSSTCST